MSTKNKMLRRLCRGAMVSALYVALTFVSRMLMLDSGMIQFRVSEALCVLPYFIPEAIPGLYIGCLCANFLLGNHPIDIVFGSIATLLGALIAYLLRNRSKFLSPLPTVLANTLICPPVIWWCYTDHSESALVMIPLTALFVAIGEVLSAYLCGMLLLLALKPHERFLFR